MQDSTHSRAGLESRRQLAVRKVTEGRSAADVADFLGLHPETVRLWVRAHRAGGDAGLAGRKHPGRRRFLTPAQEAEALAWLARRPTEFGFRTDLWTAARVAKLVQDRFGVAYHPGYPWERLAKRGQTPQKPARRARQRRPAAIDAWLASDYPALQKKSPPSAPTSS